MLKHYTHITSGAARRIVKLLDARSHPHTREAGKRKGILCVSYTAFGEDFAGSTMSGNM